MPHLVLRTVATVTWVIITCAVVLAVASWFRLVGLHHINGSSMEPTISRGSFALTLPTRVEMLQIGDVVVAGPDGRTFAHRVREIHDNGTFTLRGDANDVADPEPQRFTTTPMRVVADVPHVGPAVEAVLTPPGRYIAISAWLLALLAWVLLGERRDHRRQETAGDVEEQEDTPNRRVTGPEPVR